MPSNIFSYHLTDNLYQESLLLRTGAILAGNALSHNGVE